jgi:hypothetical protein
MIEAVMISFESVENFIAAGFRAIKIGRIAVIS